MDVMLSHNIMYRSACSWGFSADCPIFVLLFSVMSWVQSRQLEGQLSINFRISNVFYILNLPTSLTGKLGILSPLPPTHTHSLSLLALGALFWFPQKHSSAVKWFSVRPRPHGSEPSARVLSEPQITMEPRRLWPSTSGEQRMQSEGEQERARVVERDRERETADWDILGLASLLKQKPWTPLGIQHYVKVLL